jgi:hypothetical protein
MKKLGTTAMTMTEALECAIHYAEAGQVPRGRTLDDMRAIAAYMALRAARQRATKAGAA